MTARIEIDTAPEAAGSGYPPPFDKACRPRRTGT